MATKNASQGGFAAVIIIAVVIGAGYWYYENYIKGTTTATLISNL